MENLSYLADAASFRHVAVFNLDITCLKYKAFLNCPSPHINESLHGITSALQNEFCVWTTYPQREPSCYA